MISRRSESSRKGGMTPDFIGGLQFTGWSPFRVTKNGTVNGARPNRFMLWSPLEREVNKRNLAFARTPDIFNLGFYE